MSAPKAPKTPKAERTAKLAAALRANLKRRKSSGVMKAIKENSIKN